MSTPVMPGASRTSWPRCSVTPSGGRDGGGARASRSQPGGDHRLRDPRHPHAGARHDHRQRGAALHAGQRLGQSGPDRLGADLVHRRRRDHAAADRLPRPTGRDATAKLDWFGFATLSLAIGALQVLLDRGEELDWFSSREIAVEAVIGASALYLFLVHTFTAREPFVRPSLFRDRNFAAGTLFIAIVGLTYYASLALQPPYLQNLMSYPIVSAGIVMGPRGVGTMGAILVVGG